MFKILGRLAFVTSIAAALPLLLPSVSHAQLRDFEGKVDSINEKQIIVDNRKGDKLTFVKTEETTVEGDKKAWPDIKKNDWVAVSSKMLEKPRKAYKVVVKPAPADAAVEE